MALKAAFLCSCDRKSNFSKQGIRVRTYCRARRRYIPHSYPWRNDQELSHRVCSVRYNGCFDRRRELNSQAQRQNRSAKKDALRGKNDYKTDLKSELILEQLHEQINKLTINQNKIIKILEEKEKK